MKNLICPSLNSYSSRSAKGNQLKSKSSLHCSSSTAMKVCRRLIRTCLYLGVTTYNSRLLLDFYFSEFCLLRPTTPLQQPHLAKSILALHRPPPIEYRISYTIRLCFGDILCIWRGQPSPGTVRNYFKKHCSTHVPNSVLPLENCGCSPSWEQQLALASARQPHASGTQTVAMEHGDHS